MRVRVGVGVGACNGIKERQVNPITNPATPPSSMRDGVTAAAALISVSPPPTAPSCHAKCAQALRGWSGSQRPLRWTQR